MTAITAVQTYRGVTLGPVGKVIKLRLDEAKSKQGHGTRACYILGCRRADCVAANTTYQRRYRANLAGTSIGGTAARYGMPPNGK